MMQKTELLIKSKEICIFKSTYKQSKIHSDIEYFPLSRPDGWCGKEVFVEFDEFSIQSANLNP